MAGSKRQRLDRLLVERGLASSREDAKDLISGGRVTVSGFLQTKAASMIPSDAAITVGHDDGEVKWVGRGAHKLIKGLDEWRLDVRGLDCVDIGASTGGFTQVLLARGAARVAAVDVGYGQLAWLLRSDERVTVMERTNARYVTSGDIGWEADLLTVDASFISLRLLLPNLEKILKEDGIIISLVKPQFEVGRERAGKGVVRDAALHVDVLRELESFITRETGLCLKGATYSPIRGPEGNIEFIFYLKRKRAVSRGAQGDGALECGENCGIFAPEDFLAMVAEAHERSR